MKKFLWCLLLVAVVFFPVSTNAFPLKTDVLNTEKNIIMYDDWDDDDVMMTIGGTMTATNMMMTMIGTMTVGMINQ